MSRKGRTKRARERAKRQIIIGAINFEVLDPAQWRSERVADKNECVLFRRDPSTGQEDPMLRMRWQ